MASRVIRSMLFEIITARLVPTHMGKKAFDKGSYICKSN